MAGAVPLIGPATTPSLSATASQHACLHRDTTPPPDAVLGYVELYSGGHLIFDRCAALRSRLSLGYSRRLNARTGGAMRAQPRTVGCEQRGLYFVHSQRHNP
jgi:hypothetical protein